MKAPRDKSTAALEHLVAGREKFIRDAVESVIALVKDLGTQTCREEFSAHTKVKKELNDFGGFSFKCYYGMTCMGGNTVSIFFGVRLVMSAYFQSGLDGLRVEYFEEGNEWQDAFTDCMKRKSAIARERQAKKAAEENKRQEAEKRSQARKALLQKARQLGIACPGNE